MRRMLSDAQVRYLRNKQDKLIAGDNITISNDNVISANVSNVLLHVCENASDTPKNITWLKTTQSGDVEITGTLEARNADLSKLYFIINSDIDTSTYAVSKNWSEGAGEDVYTWRLLSKVVYNE